MVVKCTPRVGPCRSSLIFGESLFDGHFRETDTKYRSIRCPFQSEVDG